MELPTFSPLPYTYQKPEVGISTLNFRDIPAPPEAVTDGQIVFFKPNGVGGNHKHPRVEWFVACGELELSWLDEQGEIHQQPMYLGSQLQLIKIPSWVPHAIKNVSSTEIMILVEFADALQHDVEKVVVI